MILMQARLLIKVISGGDRGCDSIISNALGWVIMEVDIDLVTCIPVMVRSTAVVRHVLCKVG